MRPHVTVASLLHHNKSRRILLEVLQDAANAAQLTTIEFVRFDGNLPRSERSIPRSQPLNDEGSSDSPKRHSRSKNFQFAEIFEIRSSVD
jgi:hypothetical protein